MELSSISKSSIGVADAPTASLSARAFALLSASPTSPLPCSPAVSITRASPNPQNRPLAVSTTAAHTAKPPLSTVGG